MSTALEVLRPAALELNQSAAPVRVLPVPWRDPQTVSGRNWRTTSVRSRKRAGRIPGRPISAPAWAWLTP